MKVSDDILNPPRKNVNQGIDIPDVPQKEPVMKAGSIEAIPLSSNNPLPSELHSPAPKYNTLADINEYMYGDDIKKLETEEKDAEKRKRSHAIISSIGGGLSALSNLYFTTQGSPNVQQTDYTGRFVREYNDAKGKREGLREQWKARMTDAIRGDLLSRKRSEEIKAQRDWENAIRTKTWERDDARYAGEKEYRKERDTIGDQYRKAQLDQEVKQDGERLKLQRGQLQHKVSNSSGSKNLVRFLLDNGDTAELPKVVIDNKINISDIYNRMIRENSSFQAQPTAIIKNGRVTGYNPVTEKEMLNAIGMNLAKSKAAQGAIRQLSGEKLDDPGDPREGSGPGRFNPPTEGKYLGGEDPDDAFLMEW